MAEDQEYHPYSKGSDVRFMSKFPRFGHSSDFSQLASSDQDEQADYVVGILAVSFFLLSIFVFWSALIITAKCMGKRRAGLFSGRAHVVSDTKGQFAPPPYIYKLRLLFMPLGCCLILLCVALVGPGLRSVDKMMVSTQKLNRDVKDLITQGLLIMDQVKRVKWNFDDLDVDSILHVEKACPNLENNAFLSNKSLQSSIKGIDTEFAQLKEFLDETDLESVRSQIDRVMDGTDYVDSAVFIVEKNDWGVRMFAMILSGLTFFMIFASLTSLCGGCRRLPALKCMTELFILPNFVLGIFISWLVTAGLAFASISNADFCTGTPQQSGPAGTVISLFEERGITNDNIMFAAFQHYQSGCTTEDPIQHLYKYEDDLQTAIGSANKFLDKANEIGIDEISDQCGADVSPIIEGVGLIMSNLGILLGALRSTFELASCMKMSPIYSHAFEGTACTDSSESLTMLFLIMLAISVLGMVIIMLRAAMYPYKKVYMSSALDEEEDNEWEEYQAYLQYMANFVTTWGGNAADDDDVVQTKTSTYDTSSETASKSHSDDSNNQHQALEMSSTISSGDHDKPYNRDHKFDEAVGDEEQALSVFEDEERMPLSPSTSAISSGTINRTIDQSRLFYTPPTKRGSEDEDEFQDEFTPLSPQTTSITGSAGLTRRDRRLMTPDFLTPGTFRRWRQHDDEDDDIVCTDDLPKTPSMSSPKSQKEGTFFSYDNISPAKIGNRKID